MNHVSPVNRLCQQVYVASGVLAFAATFAPLWSAYESVDYFATMSLWGAVAVDEGGVALLGVIMLLAEVACLFAAGALTKRGPGLAVTIASISAIAMLLLLTKPNSATPEPTMGSGGRMLFAVSILLILTAIADVVDWFLTRRSASATQPADVA